MADLVEQDRSAQDARVAAVAPRPQPVADHRDGSAAVLLLRVERPADRRAHAEHPQQLIGGAQAGEGFGCTVAGDVQLVPPVRCDARERATLIAPGRDVVKRRRVPVDAPLRSRGEEHDQPIGVSERQRTQEQCVDDVEDGGRCSNAERERQCRYRGKAWISPRHPKRPASVLDQAVGEGPAPGVACRLADEGRVAKVLLRRDSRLGRCEPGGGPFVRLFGEMKLDLFVELRFLALPMPERAQAREELLQHGGHVLIM